MTQVVILLKGKNEVDDSEVENMDNYLLQQLKSKRYCLSIPSTLAMLHTQLFSRYS